MVVAPPRTIPVRSRQRDYEVVVGQELIAGLGHRMKALGLAGQVCIITDNNAGKHWGQRCIDSVRTAGFSVTSLTVPPGEASKTLPQAEILYSQLIRHQFSRRDAVVSLGGGVVGDLAGFVAATYHRGLALVHVPTTLLSQVDSSIGGKVAVDHPLGKNLIGAFYAPHLVLSDVATLSTLTDRERWSGLAEVVKAALIADASLFSRLETELEVLGQGAAGADWVHVVERAARIKAEIVSADEEEAGRRTLLNFGHTLGHALEAVTGYGPLTHGEAIVIGMKTAVEVSRHLGKCPVADAERANVVLSRFPRPQPVPQPDLGAVRDAVGRDKKRAGGSVRFVILTGIGGATVVDSLDRALMDFAVEHAVAQLGVRA